MTNTNKQNIYQYRMGNPNTYWPFGYSNVTLGPSVDVWVNKTDNTFWNYGYFTNEFDPKVTLWNPPNWDLHGRDYFGATGAFSINSWSVGYRPRKIRLTFSGGFYLLNTFSGSVYKASVIVYDSNNNVIGSTVNDQISTNIVSDDYSVEVDLTFTDYDLSFMQFAPDYINLTANSGAQITLIEFLE